MRAANVATSNKLSSNVAKALEKTSLQTVRTFHGRIDADAVALAALDDAAAAYSHALHSCYAALSHGEDVDRKATAERLGIQYDYVEAALRQAKGIRASVQENCRRLAAEAEGRAKSADKKAAKLLETAAKAKTAKTRDRKRAEAHHAKRRAIKARHRAARFIAETARPAPGVCFGSRKLFDQQHHLKDSGWSSRANWLDAWEAARSADLRSVGQNSKPTGNWAVRTRHIGDDTFELRVRLPTSCEAAHGRHMTCRVRLPYGADVINAQIADNRAITWTFKRDAKGWRAFAAITENTAAVPVTAGAIGVDFNAGHLAVAIIGADGNPKTKDLRRIDFGSGPSTEQQRDAMGRAVRDLVALAVERQLPIVIEDLDFQRKKAELREIGKPGYARMLSGLSAAMFRQMLVTRAFRHGVRVITVTPSFTSFQGRVRYQRQLGISVHHAAAIEIARRGLRLGESAKPWAGRTLRVSSGHDHVTFQAPDRMPGKHVWSWWGKAQGQWRAVQKAHAKALRKRRDAAVIMATDASLSADEDFLAGLTFASSTSVDARGDKRFRSPPLREKA
jgi:IS605 OrfB family transposase